MFEAHSYEAILERMLKRIPNSLDKREGSMIYDAVAPAAAELAIAYLQLETAYQEMFADTASRECLLRRAAERGITPKPATNAILKGVFTPSTLEIPLGARFTGGDFTYIVKDKLIDGEYKLECERIGIVGNQYFGTLIPIDYLQGLETASLTELLIPAEEEEETEHFRTRYFHSLQSQAFGGNIADYKEKVSSIAGIGGVKVYPCFYGGGTVKLVLVNSDYGVPSDTLITTVQDCIDPPTESGKGVGIAPIGHQVTVVPVRSHTISLEIHLTYQEGYHFSSIQASIEQTVDAYFYELNQTWAEKDSLVVRISQLESRILNLTGVLDISDTFLNGESKNIVLGTDEIAVRGEIIGT